MKNTQILDIEAASAFLKIHPQTLRQKAKQGEIPGAKPGKQWIFLKEDLVEYIRSSYVDSRPRSQVQHGDSLCCSNDLTRNSGGVLSPHHMEVEYKNLLKR